MFQIAFVVQIEDNLSFKGSEDNEPKPIWQEWEAEQVFHNSVTIWSQPWRVLQDNSAFWIIEGLVESGDHVKLIVGSEGAVFCRRNQMIAQFDSKVAHLEIKIWVLFLEIITWLKCMRIMQCTQISDFNSIQ